MAVDDGLCDGVRILLNEARGFLPARGLGVIQQDGERHAVFTYVDAFGATGYRALLSDIPQSLRPGEVCDQATGIALDPQQRGLVETRILHTGFSDAAQREMGNIEALAVRHVIARAAPSSNAPAALVIGLGDSSPLTPVQIDGIERLADTVAECLHRTALALDRQELSRRLEAVARMLPAMFRALDVREIFDQLATIAKDVLRHDFATVGLFPEGATKLVLYVQTAGGPFEFRSGPMPFPTVQTEAWQYRIVDDLSENPLECRGDSVKGGGRSSIRVAVRLEDTILGALNFTSRDPSPYTAIDLAVCHRVAEYVALALSHHRLAEEARVAEGLRAKAAQLESRVKALTEELDIRTGARRLVGESAPWRRVLTQSTQVAATEATVLLLGESGTGKEVVARFVHRASTRAGGSFIALNCAALPEQLLEAELFGYERGAFTGATNSKPGQLELAAGGTLFLDEVGEMSPSAQAKFLRVLQEREFQRLGGTRVLRTDARIVAATNRDLRRAMANGQFREDLYYRLNVFAIQLPPLRDRQEDILALSDAFLTQIGRSLGRPPAGVSREARHALLEYHWPGNVRELHNILERAAILCEGGLITTEHLAIGPPPIQEVATTAPAVPHAVTSAGDLQSLERGMVEQALQTARFNKSKAAKALGLTRQQLYVRMRRYGLE